MRPSIYELPERGSRRAASLCWTGLFLRLHPSGQRAVEASRGEEDETSQSLLHGLSWADEDLEKAGIHIGGLGDAGETLDERAKVAFRRRLAELREQLAEAQNLGKLERAEQSAKEIVQSRLQGLRGANGWWCWWGSARR